MITYSFLFFGPGLPLGFGTPSTSVSAFLLPPPRPFLSGISVGGGMAIASLIPFGIGVEPLDPDASFSGDPTVEAGCSDGVAAESALTIADGGDA